MASSSSTSSVHKSCIYDVFLSFSGEDTRRTFVDHLYVALDQQGIHTFKDDTRLEKGKRINDELLQSIEDSRLYIIIFSKNYASSSWCLNELLKIMECQKKKERIAYPVFYDVEPTEVRKQSGSVGEAFSIHKNESEVGIWREALKEAANLSGWDLRKIADGHEAQVIRLIVEEVSRELWSFNYVNIDEKLVGIKQRMQDLELFLKIGLDDVRMIGIKGMGGAGKTTLARAIFDKLSTQFEARTFVENVREVSKASLSGLNSLQKQVLVDVLKDQWITVSSVHDGINMMKMRLSGKKVLVVLDDVDLISQLEALAGDNSWFKPGSRIIITTRDEQVLLSHRVSLIHYVDLLSDEEATRLFSRYAFGKDIPVREYEKESLEVVRYAAGLPLTVKVLGSSLCGKDKPEWIDTLARLKTIPLEETIRKLGVSYESLEDEHKEIFLDVACLLKNWKMEDAIRMLDGCGFHARNGLRVLQRKSLITIEEVYETPFDFYLSDESQRCEQICIHDHIEEMGKNIVRRLHPDDPCRHSRLWVQDEINDVLACDIGTEETRCIRMELTPHIDLTPLLNMKKLRCLIVNYDTVSSDDSDYVRDGHEACKYLPNALRYLYWRCYPHRCLPKISGANNLVALEIYNSKIEQLWEGGMEMKKLKFLVLDHTRHLRTCDLGLFPNLEKLSLNGCWELVELCVPTGCLKRLVDLNLDSCKRLRSLSFIKHLDSLLFLTLSGWNHTEFPDIIPADSNSCLRSLDIRKSDIVELPSSIEKLCKLVYLFLENCKNIKSLPRSFCSLQGLKVLRFDDCGIEELPGDFGQLEYLEELSLQGHPFPLHSYCKLKHLPDSICKLKRLKTLIVDGRGGLEKLPEDLGNLESLEVLDLSRCTRITEIPSSICKLKHLKTLLLGCFTALEKLPEDLGNLESLEVLRLLSFKRITEIPSSICKLKCLKTLILYECEKIKKVPEELGDLKCLQKLDIMGCERI